MYTRKALQICSEKVTSSEKIANLVAGRLLMLKQHDTCVNAEKIISCNIFFISCKIKYPRNFLNDKPERVSLDLFDIPI